jgi:hypothetical protein
VDAGCSPQRILAAHFADQFSHVFRDRWPPGWPERTLHVQNSRKPLRCQAMTVSGLTMTKADRQSFQTSHSHVQRSRSAEVSFGRFTERCRTPSCCLSARFSTWSAARDLKAADAATANRSSALRARRRD